MHFCYTLVTVGMSILGISALSPADGPTDSPLSVKEEGLTEKLVIRLVAERQDYVSGQPIFLEDTLENLTDKVLVIPRHYHLDQLEIHIEDAIGNRVHCLRPVRTRYGPPDRDTLQPREKLIRPVPLTDCGNAEGWVGPSRILIPGEYKVSVELGGVRSNQVMLYIKPVPESDMVVKKTLLDFEDPRIGARIPLEVQNARLEELLKAFPISVFRVNIYSSLITSYYVWHGDNPKAIERLLELIPEFLDHNPNFPGGYRTVQYYRVVLETSLGLHERKPIEQHKVELLAEKVRALKTRYPGTRLERYIEEEVGRIEQRYSKR